VLLTLQKCQGKIILFISPMHVLVKKFKFYTEQWKEYQVSYLCHTKSDDYLNSDLGMLVD
jgi:hypothetical protein